MSDRRFGIVSCALVALLWSSLAWPVAAQVQDVRLLELSRPVERELAGEQAHNYLIELTANEFFHVIVDQRGVDVVVTLYAPDGKKLREVDSPNGTQGPEPMTLIAETAGNHRLEVRSLDKGAAGKYAITLTEKRAATSEDREQLAKQALLEQAQSLSNQASTLFQQGRYKDAVPPAQRSLELLEKARGPEHPDVATVLSILGLVYKAQGDYGRAEPLFQRSLAIREKALGPDHPDVADAVNSLATLYQDQGEYGRAAPLFQRALTILEKALGPDHPDVATVLNNLALLYKAQGDYGRAVPMYQRSLAIREKALGPAHPLVAQSLNNLAELYRVQGDYERAAPLYQRSLAIREKVLGPEHPAVATTLNNLATLYQAHGDYALAVPLFQRALSIREKTLGREHPLVAQSLNNLALAYIEQGDYGHAAPLYQRALEIYDKALGPDNLAAAPTLNNLAGVYQLQGDYERAVESYERSLAIYEKALGPIHPDVANTLNNLAWLFRAQAEYDRALAFQQRASAIEEKNIAQIFNTGSQQQKQNYLDLLSSQTYSAVSLASDVPNNAGAARLALTIILQRKGRALDVTSDQIAALRRRATPDDQKLLDELIATRSQLATLQLSNTSRLSPEMRRAEIIRLSTEEQRLEDAISRRSAEFRAVAQPITLDAVRQALPPDAALVELLVYQPFNAQAKTRAEKFGRPRYVAYVLRHADDVPHFVDLGEAVTIDAEAARFRATIKIARTPEAQVKTMARKLDERVMRPVRKLLGPTRRVFLSPDGALNLVPFDALVDENGHYLIEKYSFNYLTSGRDLLRLQVAGQSQDGPTIVANPLFDLKSTAGAQAPANGRRAIGLLGAGDTADAESRSTDFTALYYPPLTGTAAEARSIGVLLPQARMWTEGEATEATLKTVNRPRILHIATHGFFLPDQLTATPQQARGLGLNPETQAGTPRGENPMLRSGLILAGVNQKQSGVGEDGVLTAQEAAGLNLFGTKLVVLSACETGLGDVLNGAGVYGLRRALVLAGSETQIMSLWQVSDVATRDLMIAYYTRLQAGAGRIAAMRQVQLAMLHGTTLAKGSDAQRNFGLKPNPQRRAVTSGPGPIIIPRAAWRHPYYWAAFIPSGAWTKLED